MTLEAPTDGSRRGRRLALVGLALLLGGCPTISAHRPAVLLTITGADTAVTVGDTVRLTALLHNPGATPLALEFEDACSVELHVASANAGVVHPPGGSYPCQGAPAVLRLAPGDTHRFSLAWAAPREGIYTAYAVLGQHHELRGARRGLRLGHRSEQLRIRAHAP